MHDTIVHVQRLQFESVLDEACQKLIEKQKFYSISRLDQMQKVLNVLIDELESFIGGRHETN